MMLLFIVVKRPLFVCLGSLEFEIVAASCLVEAVAIYADVDAIILCFVVLERCMNVERNSSEFTTVGLPTWVCDSDLA